jgi:hypothetical protein
MTDPPYRQKGCFIKTMTTGVQLGKNFGRECQGPRRQDELIDSIVPVVK